MHLGHRTRRTLIRLSIVLPAMAIAGLLVMLLWNALLPGLFGSPALNYLQAVGILLLSHLLLSSSPLYSLRILRRARRRRRWKQRLASMSPEEFAAFRSELGLHGSDERQT